MASPKTKIAALGAHRGYAIHKTGEGEFYSDLDPSSWFSTKAGAEKHIDWYLKTRGNPGKKHSAAYEAGRAALASAAERYGTVNLTPSIAQREEWAWAWREFMAGWNAEKKRGNPAKFDRCVKAVKARGGGYDPYAVCTAAGRRGNAPDLDSPRAFVGRQRKDGKFPVQFVYPRTGARVNKLMSASELDALKAEGKYGVYASRNPSAFEKCVESVEAKGSARDPRAVCAAAGRAKYGQAEMTRRAIAGKQKAARRRAKPNPSGAADAVFEEFHGRPSDETLHVVSTRHHHEHLAAAGELRKLVVDGIDGREHTVTGFDGAVLAFNEDKNQLFIVGGDQSINLEDFGIKTVHEIETLGDVRKIEYFTDKEHLGDEGGEAVYTHTFRTTNEDGKHVTLRIARYPQLIYRVREQALEFSGGSYVIRAEGIDQ